MKQNLGMSSRALFVWVAVVASPLFGLCQNATWAGQVQCQLSVQSNGYTHQEMQTWTLTGGAPTQQGAMEVYPATWTVTGQGGAQQQQGAQVMTAQWTNKVPGISAPIAVFVRASDGRLIIKSWHSQLSQFSSTNSIRQVGAAQTSTAYTVYEWQFPSIDDVATSTNVSGTGTVPVTGNAIPIPSAERSGVATCKWQFTKGGSNSPQVVNAPTNLARTSIATRPLLAASAGAVTPSSAAGGAPSAGGAGMPGSSAGVTAASASAAGSAAGSANGNASGGAPGTVGNSSAGAAAGAVSGTAGAASIAGGGAASATGTVSQPNSLSTAQPSMTAPAVTAQPINTNSTGNPVVSALRAPPPPAGFKATAWDLGAVHFEWQPVPGAVKYRLEGPGLDAAGVYVSAPATNATSNHIPPGPGTWKLASVNVAGIWDRNNEATASAIVRYAPAHSSAWLTKNNGTGSVALAISHYIAACPACIPGATFGTVAAALGLPQNLIQTSCANGNGGYGYCSPALSAWDEYGHQWNPEAVYSNVTEFGTTRSALCWTVGIPPGSPGLPPRVLCYSKSGNHGLTVIAKDAQYAWFMTFASPDPNASVFDYKLTTEVTFDSEGPKHPPHACLSCHGGHWNASGARVTGSTLLPLDPGMLQVSDTGTQMGLNFLGVNQAVMASLPSPAVTRYMTGLYGGDPRQITHQTKLDDGSILWAGNDGYGNIPNPWPAMDYIPSGWSQQTDLYKKAIKPYCMMCHMATPSNLDFSTFGSFAQNKALIQADVCSGHTMPHAEYPYTQFWTKDTGNIFLPGYLAASVGITNCQ